MTTEGEFSDACRRELGDRLGQPVETLAEKAARLKVEQGHDRSRRYLVTVARLGLPDEPEHTHLAVLGWVPRVQAWVHGQAICGRTVAQGEIEPAGVCCPDCAERMGDYTLILET